MSAKHTPGPWSSQLANAGARIISANGTVICQGMAGNRANARLIASAPEMLAALNLVWDKVLTEYHSKDSYVRQQVEAAIAKAEGREP